MDIGVESVCIGTVRGQRGWGNVWRVRIDLCLYFVCIIIITYIMIVNTVNDEVVEINVILINALK